MKVQPNANYHLMGTSIRLDSTQVYDAIPATNQPDYEEREMIFVLIGEDSFLLEQDEYQIVEE